MYIPIPVQKNSLVFALGLSLLITLSLSSCSTTKKETQDGAPKKPKSVAHIQNAVPKKEPKSKYGNPETYVVFGKKYHVMDSSENYKAKGVASWYGTKFHGRRTSSGEPYDLYGMTAAHKSLPLPTYVEVTNLKNGKKVIVKVNDRGPFVDDRLIDLSYTAAKKLGVYESGTAPVSITAINPSSWGDIKAPVDNIHQPNTRDPIYIQLGAFQDAENAQRLASKALTLAQTNKIKLLIEQTDVDGNSWHKVRLGPIFNPQDLESLKKKILASNLPSPTIIQP